MTRIAVIGAGVGGLATALPLRARDIDVVILAAFEPRTLEVLAGRSGRKLLSAPVGAWARARYGRPYRAPLPSDQAAFSCSRVPSSSSMDATSMFSSRCRTEEVPGISSTLGATLSVHANAIWAGVRSRRSAISRTSG
jgi:hypothetical protein